MSFRVNFSSTILLENIPTQNNMAKGLEAVKTNPSRNVFPEFIPLSRFIRGSTPRPNTPSTVCNPNIATIIAPIILKMYFTPFRSIKDAIPDIANNIKNASAIATPNTPVSAPINPLFPPTLKTNRHTGPIANCYNIPNLNPLKIII